ncbi:MAG: DUF1800 domain-containing protein [Gammaproteobacteria bacterium]
MKQSKLRLYGRLRPLWLLGIVPLCLGLSTTAGAADPCDDAAATYCDTDQNEHVLARLGFGGDAWSRQRILDVGAFFYLREQLFPEQIADPEFEQALIPYATGFYATWGKSIAELRPQFCPATQSYCTDRRAGLNHMNWQLGEVKLLRAALSRRQLEAVLLDFWLNHFNVDGAVAVARIAMQSYEQDAIAPHALGRFEDLLRETALAPAMLDYLDLKRSRRGNVNENFARELLELHTVGKFDTYDEEDVQEVTNILTGYVNNAPDYETRYVPGRHVNGTKTVTLANTEPWVFDGTLGCDGRPAEAFETEAEVLFCLLALHPKTAEFVSRKLITRFVSEDVPDDLLQRATSAWAANGGNMRGVMLAILSSKEFLGIEENWRTKFARPQLFTARLARALGVDVLGESQLTDEPGNVNRFENSFNGVMADLELMGETLYKAGPPTGFPELSVAWVSAGGALARLNQVQRLIAPIPDPAQRYGVAVGATSTELVDALIERFLPRGVEPATRTTVIDFVEALPASAGRNVRTRQAAMLLLSSPEFLMH